MNNYGSGLKKAEDLESLLAQKEQINYSEQMSTPPQANPTSFVDKRGAVNVQDIDVDGSLETALAPLLQPLVRTETDNVKTVNPSIETFRPEQRGVNTSGVSGGVAPDFSGYDSLEKKVQALRPAKLHWAEMLGGSVAAVGGLLSGQGAVGFKTSGDQLTKLASDNIKRQEDFEKLLIELEAKRAAQMATGVRGVRSGRGGSASIKERERVNRLGETLLMTKVDENGDWVATNQDRVIKPASMGFQTLDRKDGSSRQIGKQGTMAAGLGAQNAPMDTLKTARNETVFYNKRDVNSGMVDPGARVNKTQNKLSPKADAAWGLINRDFSRDTARERYTVAANDLSTALKLLNTEGSGPLLAGQRFIGMAQDKGRSLTNDEFFRMAYLDSGWQDKITNLMLGVKEGKVGTEVLRRELKKVAAGIAMGIEELQNGRVANFNDRAQRELGDEYGNVNPFPQVKLMTGKEQREGATKITNYSQSLSTSKPKVVTVKSKKTGQIKRVYMGYNPATGQYDQPRGDAP